eukprot:TRINITY_DN32214_c0_g1_i1.p1 TRINITY_DN32214_c0_g1~~TRINITY_DN32214_c0_g1_i1.p1  ORF type:complete len:381 (-),score=68.85 TRINITY_DN32214_c0_g1_i1:63-1205(-)
MAPVEDLQSRDLAWISDFVMNQMVLMMRPLLEQLQQTDSSAEYANRAIHRMSMDIAELRMDMERTNKYMSILRQGLGVQNEGKCLLQRGLDSATRTAKRLDEQMETMTSLMRGLEDTCAALCLDFQQSNSKHDELSKKVSESSMAMEDLQVKIDRISKDSHFVKDDILGGDARVDWQSELGKLQRSNVCLVPKLEEKVVRGPPSSQGVRGAPESSWPSKKVFSTALDVSSHASGGGGNTPVNFKAASSLSDTASNHSGSQQSKRLSRVGSSSSKAALPQQDRALQQDHLSSGMSRKESRVWSPGGPSNLIDDTSVNSGGNGSGGDGQEISRLPLLGGPVSRQSGSMVGRPAERTGVTSEGPRLRFTATMANLPPSRGTAS